MKNGIKKRSNFLVEQLKKIYEKRSNELNFDQDDRNLWKSDYRITHVSSM